MNNKAQANTPASRVYTRSHSFFDDVVTMLFQLTANMWAFSNFVALNGMQEKTKRYLASYGWMEPPITLNISYYPEIVAHLHHIAAGTINPKEPFSLSSREQPYYAYFYPYEVVAPVCENSWPSKVEIFFGAKPVGDIAPDPNLKQVLSSSEHQYPMKAAIRSSFISYFESQRGVIENKYTRQVENWPMVWNFARVVRNACGHGGVIRIDNPKADAVMWRNYRYDHGDNGKSVLYGKDGLSTVDVILLFEDMHDQI